MRCVIERRKGKLKINEFLTEDLDLFREQCNFSSNESSVFELKAKGWTDVQIAIHMNMSESNIQVIMRKIRTKIDEVLRRNVRHLNTHDSDNRYVVCHSMAEWSKIPDFLSGKGIIYIYSDYRTENDINIPRIKIGDGIHSLSEIPFATMSITDSDMSYWDDKPDMESNDFGKIIEIDNTHTNTNKYVFPSDGYIMLEFENDSQSAQVNIYGASGQTGFTFEKRPSISIHSKEVFVRRGMQCEYVQCSVGAKIKFIPLA